MKDIKHYFVDTVRGSCENSPINGKNNVSKEPECINKVTEKFNSTDKTSRRDSKNKNVTVYEEESFIIDDSSDDSETNPNECTKSNAFNVLMNRNKLGQNNISSEISAQEFKVRKDASSKEVPRQNGRKSTNLETKEKAETKVEDCTKVTKRNGKTDNIIVSEERRSSGKLFDYFSKSTLQLVNNDMVKMSTIVVKADVHVTESSITKLPQRRIFSKTNSSKIMEAKLRNKLSEINNIDVISSEDLTILEDAAENQEIMQKKTKPRWAFQIKSFDKNEDYTSDAISDSEEEIFSPRSRTKANIRLTPKSIRNVENTNTTSKNSVIKTHGKIFTKNSSDQSKLKLRKKDKSKVQEKNSNASPSIREDEQRKNKKKGKEADTKRKKAREENSNRFNVENSSIIDDSSTKDSTDSIVEIYDNNALKIDSAILKNEKNDECKIVCETSLKRKCPEMLAPLFTKRRKPDPIAIAARRSFLQPDMISNRNNGVEKSPNSCTTSLLPFPTISHITQIDKSVHINDQCIHNIVIKNLEEYIPNFDKNEYKYIINLDDTESIKVPVGSTIENLEEGIAEIEVFFPDAKDFVNKMWPGVSSIAKNKTIQKVSPKRKTRGKRISNKESVSMESKTDNDETHNVWTCKYKPKSSQEIAGNEDAVAKLKSWLEGWKAASSIKEDTDSGDEFYSSDCSYSSNCEKNQVAVLIGPHGCGKSASVYAIAEEFGYSVLEVNASSKRPGKKILKEFEEATTSHRIKKEKGQTTFLPIAKESAKKMPQNSLILLEDIDLIFEEDEGFISAAYQLASKTKRPIVMTCRNVCTHLNKMAPQQNRIYFHDTISDKRGSSRACALLGLISLAETGYKLSKDYLMDLMKSGDLRKAILQLQFLLMSGTPYTSRYFVDYKDRLWQDMRHCLYKPAIKTAKIPKAKEKNDEAATLQDLANRLDSLCVISSLVEIEDSALRLYDPESQPNLSLTEDASLYSHIHTISSEMAEWMNNVLMQRKKDITNEEQQYCNNLLLQKQLNIGVDRALSHVTSFQLDNCIISVDYLPFTRSICRAEESRAKSNNKRGNRFFHYLHNLKMPVTTTKPNILDAACKILQEKAMK